MAAQFRLGHVMTTEGPDPHALPRGTARDDQPWQGAAGTPPPAVSVITPARDAARFLDATIRSVVEQTFADWELLLVDDASRDETAGIARRWADSDSRIRFRSLASPQGAAAARNTALEAARGRYLAFLDSDDLWRPAKLETQVAFMRDAGALFSFTGYSLIDEDGRRAGRAVRAPERVDYRFLLRNTIIGCLTVMLDRERLGPLRMPALRQHEDLCLWYDILKRGVIAQGIPLDLALYRVVRGSASRNKQRAARHMWTVYRVREDLPVGTAMQCFAQYAWNALRKGRF